MSCGMDAEGRWWFEALDDAGRRDAARRGRARDPRLAHLLALLAAAPEPRRPRPPTFSLRAARRRPAHMAAVADCVERIAAGEIFQANLCLRLEATYDGERRRPLRRTPCRSWSPPTAPASSRRGAASRASRPSSSCAAAGAR